MRQSGYRFNQDLNLDLVQFPRPVVVTEIRIVPLGTCVNLNLPGSVRLGATNPSSFKLELFVNNLSKPNASTFEKLGILEYKANVDILLRTDNRVPTDGLIIKGWYQTITLALYGVLTTVVQDRSSPPPPPPPNLRSKPLVIVPGVLEKPEMVLTQKATLERTQEWAEKAAAALLNQVQTTHRPSSVDSRESSSHHRSIQPVVESLHSPLSSPTPINPRDIPLEHHGGTPRDPRDTPRDPRDHSPRYDRDDQEPSQTFEDRLAMERGERRTSLGSLEEQEITRSRNKDLLIKSTDLQDKDQVERDGKNNVSYDRDDYSRTKDADRDKKKKADRLSRESDKDYDGENVNRHGSGVKLSDIRHVSDGSNKAEHLTISPPIARSRQTKRSSPELLMDEDAEPGEIPENTDDIYESIDQANSPNDDVDKLYSNLSDGEIQEGDDNYSQISSEENIEDELPSAMVGGGDLGDWEEDVWKYDTVASFNPYQCDLAPLETFSDPSLTAYELEKQKIILTKESTMPEAAKQILSIIETFKNVPLHDKWIEAMERLPGLLIPGLVYLVNKTENKDALDTIISWTCEGLDLQKAIQQPEAAYKVRHLKMGIRVAGALCMCDSYVAFQMLSREVQHKLIDLYVSQHMSSSIKLHIISALDQTTRLKEGLDWLLGRHHLQVAAAVNSRDLPGSIMMTDAVVKQLILKDEVNCGDGPIESRRQSAQLTGYQRIIEIMLTKQCVRPMVGLATLVRKVHVYEVLLKLMSSLDSLLESLPSSSVEAGLPKGSAGITGVDEVGGETVPSEVDMMDVSRMELDAAVEEEIEVLIQCLEEIAKVLANPDNILGQPRRALPNHSRFEITKKQQSMFGNLLHMFSACRLLESLFVLLCTPVTCVHATLFAAIKTILTSLVSTSQGLLYLNCRVETVNGILRALTQNADYGQDEDRELNPANQLGLFMIYHLQTLQHVDQLIEYRAKDSTASKDVDDAEVLAILHSLYSITFTPQGRDAVVTVFTLEDNISVLTPFIEMTGDEVRDLRIRRSVCCAYAVMLLVLVARHSERVEWLAKFGHKVLGFVEKETSGGGKANDRVTELHDWLAPIKQIPVISSDPETIAELTRQLRQYSEEVSDLPKGLINVLRVMQHLAIAPTGQEDLGHVEELKYKFVLVEIYGANCLSLFSTVLQKVYDVLLLPWQQGFPQTVSQRTLILSLVKPALALMKALLSYLILARGSDFKDLSCLPCLLHIHTVLCSVSSTGVLSSEIQQVQNNIVDTLMAYTQPCLAKEESEEALSQSLWSMMVKQVLVYTLTAPYTFLSGLILISEMLPIPLPVQTKETLTLQELTEIINNRKRWSAHLHPHSKEIQNIIHSLAGSLCQPLHQVLRRVCWQLADLAVPTALTVVRSLLDALLESLDASCGKALTLTAMDTTSVSDGKTEEVPSSSQTARILNLFAFLVNQTQTTVKSAFLYMPQSGVKTDEKYMCVLQRLANLLNIVSESPYHVQAQESIVAFCDMDITLVPLDSNLSFQELLANSLPSKDQLALVCHGLLEHINNRDQKFSSILPSLRTLTLLMNHDYGFYYVKQAMEQVPTAFFNLFMQINATFSKDSSDCIATLSSAAECIEFLVSKPDSPNGLGNLETMNQDGFGQIDQSAQTQERTYTMSYAEARNILKWPRNEDVVAHPLNDLDVLLCEYAKDEETLKAVYQSVNAVVGILKSDEGETANRPEVMEPVMPAGLPLTAQFNMRTIYVITDGDERLNNIYWLTTPMGDESDHEQEMAKIPCDFIEMSSVYCPGFDLKAELEKGSTSPENTLMPKRKRRLGAARRSTDTINTSKMRGANGGFVAPMRGRGFGRGMNAGRGDMFRSRPPNTSRPPSMHVDDYTKLEMQQGGTSSSTSMPPPSLPPPGGQARRVDDAGHTMFERYGTRGFPGRGHFYTPPGYGHRDNVSDVGRGGYRGGGVMMSHGGGLPSPRGMLRGTATGIPMMGRGSPAKSSPVWGGRNTRQAVYGRPAFVRGEEMPPGGGALDRMDRPREGMNTGAWYISGGAPWPEHKDRQPDQRFMTLPPPGALFNWRDRGRQRTSTR